MVFQLEGNKRIPLVPSGIYSYDVHCPFGEIPENGFQYKSAMGDVAGRDFVTDVNQGESGVGAEHPCLDGCNIMVAISGIAKQGDNGHVWNFSPVPDSQAGLPRTGY